MRTVILLLGLSILAVLLLWRWQTNGSSESASGVVAEPIQARPISLHPANHSNERVGALRWLGGWALTSDDGDFGGISAMTVLEGDRIIAIGDAGGVFRFSVTDDGLMRTSVAALSDGPSPQAGGLPEKADRDAEAMARDPNTGRIWIGFERANAIWRYSSAFVAKAHIEPPPMRDWPANGGPEAMVRLPDGRFLVFAEEARRTGGASEGLIFSGDPAEPRARPQRFDYVAPEGFAVTDAAMLADGRLLILHRRFTMIEGPSAILAIVDIAGLDEGSRLVGRPIAALRSPLTVDNMEALAVSVEAGRTIIWLASDDNFNPFQRTLLMRFELIGE